MSQDKSPVPEAVDAQVPTDDATSKDVARRPSRKRNRNAVVVPFTAEALKAAIEAAKVESEKPPRGRGRPRAVKETTAPRAGKPSIISVIELDEGSASPDSAAIVAKPRNPGRPRKASGTSTSIPTPDVTLSTDAEASAVAVNAPSQPPSEPQPTSESQPTVNRSRRGGRRGVSNPATQDEPTPTDSNPMSDSVTITAEGSASSPEAELILKTTPRAGSSRNRRGGRKQPTSVAINESEVAEAANIDTTPDVDSKLPISDAASDPVVPETREKQRRGSRRGRRNGRKTTDTVTLPEVIVESDTPAEEVPEDALISNGAPSLADAVMDPDTTSSGRRVRGRPRKPAQTKVVTPPVVPVRGGRVIVKSGAAELQINGVTVPPILFFGTIEGQREERKVVSEVQRAARAGVHIHSTLVELLCPLPPDDSVLDVFDARMQLIVDADPNGYVLPRIVFAPSPTWARQYPEQMSKYVDGTTSEPSLASDLFWQEAERALEAVVTHLNRAGYGERVIGFHLERGEWFHPVDGGYDRSYANREGFRHWLRAKYGDNNASLRAAWQDNEVMYYTAEIPPLHGQDRVELAFFDARRGRRWIDFLEYSSDITAERLIALAASVKRSSVLPRLVSLCYGYTFEFGHTFSGHLALEKVLRSPHIDILSGPPSYRDRRPGGSASLPGPIDSCALHGKLWISEDDTKTHLAPTNQTPDDFNPRMEHRHATDHAHNRSFGRALATRTGVALMDTWGEGWLDSSEIWDTVTEFVSRYQKSYLLNQPRAHDVVVLVDEESLVHIQKGPDWIKRILKDNRDVIQRSAVSVGLYLQSDVVEPNFPTNAKLYVFLNPYRISTSQREAIRSRLCKESKTLVWMFAPGACDERGEPLESAHDITGFTLKQQSWSSEIGTKFVSSRNASFTELNNTTLGARDRVNPSFFADDPAEVEVIGEYQQSGLASVALRKTNSWQSIFVGEPNLSIELFRCLCKSAGVPIYVGGTENSVVIGQGWIVIHTVRDGEHTITLPVKSALFDVSDNRFIGRDVIDHKFYSRGRSTKVFYFGEPGSLESMGLSLAARIVHAPRPSPVVSPEPIELTPALSPQVLAPSGFPDGESLERPFTEDSGPNLQDTLLAIDSIEPVADNIIGEESSLDIGVEEEVSAAEDEVVRNRKRRAGRSRFRRRRPSGGSDSAQVGDS